MITKTLPFVKVEAVGNNFVLVNALLLPEMNWPLLAQRMCSHHFGVGSDGLLALVLPKKANFGLRMFNPDGTEDVSGNGMRCTAAYAFLSGLHSKREVTFEMRDGVHPVEILGSESDSVIARVNMGKPLFGVKDLPANVDLDKIIDLPVKAGGHTYNLTCMSVGTPHAVIFAPAASFWDCIPEVSSVIENHPIFPERINVDWCDVESHDAIKISTWERGVGPTMGCGTGACAALVAANVCGRAGRKASVTSHGGTLDVEWHDNGDVLSSGQAEIIYQGNWPLVGDEEVETDS
ncbi:MAG TPA: diaminopimelate epimerase [Armatimonadota bacterium]|jgi:diaminopimelate epimerase